MAGLAARSADFRTLGVARSVWRAGLAPAPGSRFIFAIAQYAN
jgi:hypothetical protein